jgi:hypothetical protein
MDTVLRFRVATDEADLLKRAAGEAGLDFSAWARTRLLRDARYVLEGEISSEESASMLVRPPAVKEHPVEIVSNNPRAPASVPERFRTRPDPEKIQEAQRRLLRPRKK